MRLVSMHMPHRLQRHFTLLDGIALVIILLFLIWFIYRVETVIDYSWNWGVIPGYILRIHTAEGFIKPNLLLTGFFTTLRISVWGTLLACAIGTVFGLMRAYGTAGQRLISRMYVEGIRNLPSLVLVLIFYFLISSRFLDPIGIDVWLRGQSETVRRFAAIFFADAPQINAFISAVITLAIYEGAYITEIIRGGLIGVPDSQWETAYAHGLTGFQAFRFIILPQAVRNTISPLTGQFISAIKDSAIMSVISIQELTFQGMELMSATFLTFEVWITVTVLYFLLTFSLSRWAAGFEKQLHANGS